MSLDYYREERERYPEMDTARCSPDEARLAVRKLARHFKLGVCRLSFTSGRNHSHYSAASGGGVPRIRLNVTGLSWLTVAHEVGHWMDHTDRVRTMAKLRQQVKGRLHPSFDEEEDRLLAARIRRVSVRRWHGKHHARAVSRCVKYIVKMGWHTGALAKALSEKALREEERERRAAMPPPLQARIEKREQQVRRLTTRIKALTTRRRNAMRSLAALRRQL
jgi:hypothetical protein